MKDHVGGFFGDHDRWCICVAGGQIGHDGGINDAKALESDETQIRRYNAVRVIGSPHPAGADRVVVSLSVCAGVLEQFLIGIGARPGQDFALDEAL